MKKYLRTIPVIFISLSLSLSSCSKDDENLETNADFVPKTADVINTLTFQNSKAVVKSDGTFDYYLNNEFQYTLDVVYQNPIEVQQIDDDIILSSGSDTIEFKYSGNSNLEFNVMRSDQNGTIFGSMSSTIPMQAKGCIPCYVGPIMWLIDTVIEALEPSEAENCATAAATSCGSGNVKSFKSVINEGFFGDSISCEFECKD